MIDLVVARLRDRVPGLRRVQAATDVAAVVKAPDRTALPSAHVYPTSDVGGPNRLVGAVSQRVESRFAVLLGVAAAGAGREAAAAGALTPVLAAVRAELVGREPEGLDPVLFARGGLADVAGGVAWRIDEFSTSYLLRKA